MEVRLKKQVLEILAVGLLQQQDLEERQASQPVTQLNPYVRHAWEQIYATCIENRIAPPSKLRELVLWLYTPLAEWDVIVDAPETDQSQSLLDEGLPTALCEELGGDLVNAPDPYLEIQDGPFKDILAAAHEINNPAQYTLARAFIGRHPIVEDRIATIQANTNWDDLIRTHLVQCYEPILPQCFRSEGGKKLIYCCPRCGWALRWKGDEAVCYQGGPCADLVGDLAAHAEAIPYKREMVCTTEGIQKYVVAPEIDLFYIHDKLQHEWGALTELYPDFDLFDLLVKFPNGAVWAVDVKDYRQAARLARKLNEKPFAWGRNWTQAFYIFPDYRATPDYLNIFKIGWIPQKDVNFTSTRDFLALARKELAR